MQVKTSSVWGEWPGSGVSVCTKITVTNCLEARQEEEAEEGEEE